MQVSMVEKINENLKGKKIFTGNLLEKECNDMKSIRNKYHNLIDTKKKDDRATSNYHVKINQII